jgi:hypothetical protein
MRTQIIRQRKFPILLLRSIGHHPSTEHDASVLSTEFVDSPFYFRACRVESASIVDAGHDIVGVEE